LRNKKKKEEEEEHLQFIVICASKI